MIFNNFGRDKVVELKYASNCKAKPIINTDGTINVNYLQELENGKYALNQDHCYYTQCQILMYCTATQECDFFIHSSKHQSILISVERNESFLKKYIPKLQHFYFNYLLPVLIKKYGL